MAEVEIGMGKAGRRAYELDDVSILPARRTRDLDAVDVQWEIDAFTFPLPIMAAAMDSVVSPATAVAHRRARRRRACWHLEGLWTRYEDPEPVLDEIAGLEPDARHGPDPGALRRADQARR